MVTWKLYSWSFLRHIISVPPSALPIKRYVDAKTMSCGQLNTGCFDIFIPKKRTTRKLISQLSFVVFSFNNNKTTTNNDNSDRYCAKNWLKKVFKL